MSSERDAFLRRVRQAVRAGNRPGEGKPIEPRGGVGYQGAGPDPTERFCTELTAAGGQAHPVPDRESAAARVLELVQSKSARSVLVGRGPLLDALGLPERLRTAGIEAVVVDQLTEENCRDPFFAADVGISGVDYLIAETGSIVLQARPGEPRSLSLLPPVHIAVAERAQILPDLFDLFECPDWQPHSGPPSCLTLITGPSKTGDIELRLVTGVHGPGEVHVVLIA
ncbi:MAG TPA: lactate utilization protein [Gemmataceae bacterium]|nr:lactate utilization protein [Gemmataceae bacterium]